MAEAEVTALHDRHWVVVGSMGVGKTTTGRALAEAAARPYVDSDADISRLMGHSGAVVAAEHGIEVLHDVEAGLLLGALAREQPQVVTAAASVVERAIVREVLARRAFVVRLVAAPEVVLERQRNDDHRRPMDATELATLEARREPFFVEIADLTLESSVPTEALVVEVLQAVGPGRRP